MDEPQRHPESPLVGPGRLSLAVPLLLAFLGVSALTRIGLAVFNADSALFEPLRLGPALLYGLGYDTAVALWWCLPLVLLGWWWPRARAPRALGWTATALAIGLLGGLVFVSVAEFVFWNEFASRFNFIAVDYLIYTREVIGNIRESYPLAPMFAAIGAATGLLSLPLVRPLRRAAAAGAPCLGRRSLQALAYLGTASALTVAVNSGWKERLVQPQLVQVAGNGVWEFFHALRYNQIDYARFYATLPTEQAEAVLRHRFDDPAHYRPMPLPGMPIRREVVPAGPRRDMNVVLVSIESLGAEFVESLGGAHGLTPNLERLGREGLLFTHMYATGTRTVRGLEALTLSVPPTPGHAVPMRPDNGGLFTLGGVLKAQGWEPLYVYGGYSYFDNMSSFFGGNGYTVIDRSAIDKKDIHHENIWGVADEDLFDLALREIDVRAAAGRKVFAHVMTTSNHRPFTYPEGRIDIPSGSGREGAVKYTDHAIGQFVEKARARPWFGNTLFVFVADHTSIARGRSDLPMERYHIPMVVYAPGKVMPRSVDALASQIDVAPTVLGLLNLGYVSEFFGRDVLRDNVQPSLFMANYQTVGFVGEGVQVELRPKRGSRVFGVEGGPPSADQSHAALDESIAFYQVAADRFSSHHAANPAPALRR
ncbi:LTA synthase family protein [uncultured Piscinibacter sp.]|uniref:LTA synthase family protein n=1 Tax=uncultured Piscinibacter sp. TaxID=1131835 RepID=UPI002608ED7A|nr:LTA synthase family protein [uncultured Piscinibacter sp.]